MPSSSLAARYPTSIVRAVAFVFSSTKPAPDARDRRIAELERENVKLDKRARRAEAMVALQKRSGLVAGDPLQRRAEREGLMHLVAEAIPELGVVPACETLGVPRASFYRWRAPMQRHTSAEACGTER